MNLTYAGVPLNLATEETLDWIDLSIPLDEVRITVKERPSTTPGTIGLTRPFRYPARPDLGKLGTLFVPTGIARWSEAHYLISQQAYDQIVPLAFSNTGPVPRNLVIEQNGQSITVQMYALPPRVLASQTRCYLLSLVDNRWFTQFQNAGVPRLDTWDHLLADLITASKLTITVPVIPAVYGLPNPQGDLSSQFENVAIMLEAALKNCGLTAVPNLDGTFRTLTPLQSAAITLANRKAVKVAGGSFLDTNLSNGSPNLTAGVILPQQITTVFPRLLTTGGYCNAQTGHLPFFRNLGDLLPVTVSIGDVGFAGFGGGYPFTETFQDLAPAYYTDCTDANPQNLTQIVALAKQLATDYYQEMLDGLDEVYPNVQPWQMESLHDLIYTWDREKVHTRVQRHPLNYWSDVLWLHWFVSGSGSGGSFSSSTSSSSSGSSTPCYCLPDACQGCPPYSMPSCWLLIAEGFNNLVTPTGCYNLNGVFNLEFDGNSKWTTTETLDQTATGCSVGPIWSLHLQADGLYHLLAANSDVGQAQFVGCDSLMLFNTNGYACCDNITPIIVLPGQVCSGDRSSGFSASQSISQSGSTSSRSASSAQGVYCITDACVGCPALTLPSQWYLSAPGLLPDVACDCGQLGGDFILYYQGDCTWKTTEVVDQRLCHGQLAPAWQLKWNHIVSGWELIAAGITYPTFGVQPTCSAPITFAAENWFECDNTLPIVLTPATVCPKQFTVTCCNTEPMFWTIIVSGFESQCFGFNGSWILLQIGACLWRATSDAIIITLQIIGEVATLLFQNNGAFIRYEAVLALNKDCCDPLVFHRDGFECAEYCSSATQACVFCETGATPANITFEGSFGGCLSNFNRPFTLTNTIAACFWTDYSDPNIQAQLEMVQGQLILTLLDSTTDAEIQYANIDWNNDCCSPITLAFSSYYCASLVTPDYPPSLTLTPSLCGNGNCPDTITAMSACGSNSSNSSSSSSSGPTVLTPCCGDTPLPLVLNCLITNVNRMECIDGLNVTLTYDSVSQSWLYYSGAAQPPTCQHVAANVSISLQCVSPFDDISDLVLAVACQALGSLQTSPDVGSSCGGPALMWTDLNLDAFGTCPCGDGPGSSLIDVLIY